jgi:hypothetical protein
MVMNDKKTFILTHAHDNIFDAHEPEWDDRLKLTFIPAGQDHIISLAIPLMDSVADILFVRQPQT